MTRSSTKEQGKSVPGQHSIDHQDDSKSHSFVLKIWIKEASGPDEMPTWRGRITHVMEGKYKYLKTIEELFQFLLPYFNRMGIQIKSDEDFNIKKTPNGHK